MLLYLHMFMFIYLFMLFDHYLMFLIGLEFIMSLILFYFIIIEMENLLFTFILVYSVCEVVIGLSLMVSMVFGFGHRKISFFNLC